MGARGQHGLGSAHYEVPFRMIMQAREKGAFRASGFQGLDRV